MQQWNCYKQKRITFTDAIYLYFYIWWIRFGLFFQTRFFKIATCFLYPFTTFTQLSIAQSQMQQRKWCKEECISAKSLPRWMSGGREEVALRINIWNPGFYFASHTSTSALGGKYTTTTKIQRICRNVCLLFQWKEFKPQNYVRIGHFASFSAIFVLKVFLISSQVFWPSEGQIWNMKEGRTWDLLQEAGNKTETCYREL